MQMVQKLLREAEQAGQDEEVQPETDDEEWTGIPDTVPEELPVDMEEEYIDEDRYTTVTVETVTLDRDGLHKIVGAMVTGGEEEQVDASDQHKKSSSGRESKAQKDRSADRPKKKKKFRYETKVERRISERKQRMKGART